MPERQQAAESADRSGNTPSSNRDAYSSLQSEAPTVTQTESATTERPENHEVVRPNVMEVGKWQLDLTEEQARVLDDAVQERNGRVTDEIALLHGIGETVAKYRGANGDFQVSPVDMVLDGAQTSLVEVIGVRLQGHLASPEGASDREIMELRQFLANPDSLAAERRDEIAKRTGVKTGGLRARLQASHAQSQEDEVRKAVAARVEKLAPARNAEEATSEASFRTDQMARPALQRARETGQPLKAPASGRDSKPQQVADRLAAFEAALVSASHDLTEQFQGAEADTLRPLLSAIARGYTTPEQVFNDLKSRYRDSISIRGVVQPMLQVAADEAAQAFAEPSLVGASFGEAEKALLLTYAEQIQGLRDLMGARYGADADTIVVNAQANQARSQAELVNGVDTADTLYVHFTPNANRIFRDGRLQPGVAPDIINTTGGHSNGVHFIKPGDFTGSEALGTYMGYSHLTRNLENGIPIPESLGVALVYPLDKIIATTPLRNEIKTLTSGGEHAAPDSTFRTSAGATDSYSLDDAYIVPFYSDRQVPAEQREIGRDEQGRQLYGPFVEPIKQALRAAGKDEAWIDSHVVDVPYNKPDGQLMQLASAEIKRRLAEAGGAQKVVVPLSAKPGQWETLDVSGETRSGGVSTPNIEQLIEVRAA